MGDTEHILDMIGKIEENIKALATALNKVSLAVENLALQTTNNQVETRKTLDALRGGVLDTNLAVKFSQK